MSREEWFKMLENFIFEENRIITYKTLSSELKIHANQAKHYLSEFLQVQTSKKGISLKSSYFITGIVSSNGVKALKAIIVSDDQLTEYKESLSEVTSCQIYSLGKRLLDHEELYNIDLPHKKNGSELSNLLPIKHSSIRIRAPVVIRNSSKSDIQPTKPSVFAKKETAVKTASPPKISSDVPKDLPSSEKVSSAQPSASVKSETNPSKKKSDVKPKQSNGILSMWQKNENKQKNNKVESSSAPEKKEKTKSPQKSKQTTPTNNILSMFSKQSEKNAISGKTATSSHPEIEKAEAIAPKTSVTSNLSHNKASETKTSKPTKRKINQRQSKQAKSNKSDDGSDGDIKPTKKKHRRIYTYEESDSESESEETRDKAQRDLLSSEDPMEVASVPDTPVATPASGYDSEDPIPPTPPVVSAKGKKRIFKTVQKTFEDEDGFFVTKQEKILVSESDDEEPIPQKSPKKDVTKEKQITYRKQASLTSFFKQK